MNRNRRVAAGSVAGLAAILGLFAVPTARAAPETEPVPTVVTASEWACLAIGGIDVGACIDNPLPDISGLPTVPEILDDVLGLLDLLL